MRPVISLVLVLVCILLPACSSGSRSPTPSPTATEVTEPTLGPAAATSSDITTPVSATTAPSGSTQVTASITDLLNVRGGPGLNYPVKTQLKQGDTITIIGKSADGLWWEYSGGWVSATYVQVSADATAVPVTTPQASPSN